ncbi:DUF4332 domain-containing protein [Rubripirellula reticaptiva]|uniref:DUF4332 domain-containing protein n=1 Tax=Rubripirellula reticaptiva TaxID=2528013 RepID=A0A5C6EPP0_9BACT|nr:DUF4332 domain-containing protein [Rubripirellula reticaptiva]TWU49571.1 hypothetical protein Poly59_41880 [Rubripirellula reticaptiva]
MLLDRIDIDAHGPLNGVELGPFSEHLNVVTSPDGSGKTAIVRFIRDSLVNREYPLGMMSSSTGRVVWADRHGMLHCRREKDGTAGGRRSVQFESRGDKMPPSTGFHHASWASVTSHAGFSDSALAMKSIQLPESLVDGVITDATVTSVSRVVSACVRNGLDSPETYRSIPLGRDSVYADRDANFDSVGGYRREHAGDRRYENNQQLREELASIEAELGRLRSHRPIHRTSASNAGTYNSHREHELNRLHDQARGLRCHQAELRRWIDEIDNEASRHGGLASSVQATPDYHHYAAISDESLRRALDDLDTQMIRWQRAMLEVRGLRQAMLAGRDTFARYAGGPIDEAALRQMRLDGFYRAVDRYEPSRGWDDLYHNVYSGAGRPLVHLDEVEARIDAATRNIDWLLSRYTSPDKLQHAWFETIPSSVGYRSATSLEETLRVIRQDLRSVQLYTKTSAAARPTESAGSLRRDEELAELSHSESWLVAAIEGLNRHRDSLLRQHSAGHESKFTQWSDAAYRPNWVGLRRERDQRSAELARVSAELDHCLRTASELRRSMRSLPVIDSYLDHTDAAYVRSDYRPASDSRIQWLEQRRQTILEQLRATERSAASRSPLSVVASRWLVRLSAGRLQTVQWHYQIVSHQDVGVTINGRAEDQCTAADRAIASMAVRMAAGELLDQLGRPVPLILETHRELFQDADFAGYAAPMAYFEHGEHGRSNHPIAAALRDYAHRGRQIVVLTSHQGLADQLARVGARDFAIRGERVVHAHRPIWRPQYAAESYVGPHPHTNGENVVHAHYAVDGRADDVNRDFDMAWREAYGLYDNPERRHQAAPLQQHAPAVHPVDPSPVYGNAARTDWARDGVDYRDGYYFTDNYTTDSVSASVNPNASANARMQRSLYPETTFRATDGPNGHVASPMVNGTHISAATAPAATPQSPFFLSVDSPIDQAPSIDAVAAARLRGLSVTHINHLMQQDSNRLADALGLTNVVASTIRRWQAECRLVCRVPQLRGFDARVLVGCGILTPAQLASIHPVDLLERVEDFLATDRGQQLLLSGSSHELSRLTSWIAAANSNSDREFGGFARGRNGVRYDVNGNIHRGPGRANVVRAARGSRRSYYRDERLTESNDRDADFVFDSDRYEYENNDGLPSQRGRRRRSIRTVESIDRDSLIDDSLEGSVRRERNAHANRNGTSRNGSSHNGTSRNGSQQNRTSRNGSSQSNGYGLGSGYGSGYGSGSGSGQANRRNGSRSSSSSESTPRETVRYEQDLQERLEREPRETRQRRSRKSSRENGEARSERRRDREPRVREERSSRDSENELRFYLQRDSPIVDAPSIGARMAERLHAIGIYTVDDLLNADSESVAEQLGHRRIDADTVLQWQQQATLVCRVPMLRGHDAQLMVMAEVTTPEELAVQDADDMFAIIDAIASSTEGKRIIRNGKAPDLAEVTEWIGCAQHHRELRAA